ncbi:MAG TPA: sigma-54-dependent Fis family transcriptional regulator [Aromatoleum sp.]|uniref:sigma-54-dependent Fis family transcriptional regulator n=1 Tax=Aromatoleum sp. TaxID=2307007 RepID=UPI002B47E896|nr:sigma-54-dependent Fis family transcriptional regulator [Aromatoleum sp.]HJV27323.1 sigma-54-dependent Fis family transcriptional regulator [Aromatoleum sp.]
MNQFGSRQALLDSLAVGKSMPSGTAVPGRQRIAVSRQRSQREYGLDPGAVARERVLTAERLAELREREERFLRIATPGINWLHQQIGGLGYCILLTDRNGATVDRRAHPRHEREFEDHGLRVGACWSEQDQGTCGIGTALIDRAPLLVHEAEHFLIRNHGISCSAVPLFGPCEEILGVLNTTAISANTDRGSQSVAYNLSLLTASRIEQAIFFEENAASWVIRLSTQPESWTPDDSILLAFDEGGRVVCMSRQLRHQLPNPHGDLRIEDLLDVTAERLLRFAHTNPGVPITIPCVLGVSSVHAQIRSPRKPVPAAAAKGALAPSARATSLAGNASTGFEGLAVSDPRLLENISRIKLLANNRIPILLLGETGAGKERFAKAIHDFSRRRDKPFIAINCAAIPETLIESELFGYKEGAFTGARAKGNSGKIAQANGGTLFLDEIGDMPLALQTRLLRVLAEGELVALGASVPERVDVSVICATHRDLPSMVRDKLFREDLFYRLNAATFRIPALRERSDVVDVIRMVFAEEAASAERTATLSAHTERRLLAYRWPGNIRELRNVLRYAIAVCTATVVGPEHLPETFGETASEQAPPRNTKACVSAEERKDRERDALVGTLSRCGWNATEACRQLGMSRSTFYRKLKEHGIVPSCMAPRDSAPE